MNNLTLNPLLVISLLLVSLFAGAADAAPIQSVVKLQRPTSFESYPVVITGVDLPQLTGATTEYIELLSVDDGKLRPISFQIDARDDEGRFILNDEENEAFDDNDELVFMVKDVGTKLIDLKSFSHGSSITEIEITDPESGTRNWVYAVFSDGRNVTPALQDLVRYDSESDTISTENYRIMFVAESPFLVDTLNLVNSSNGEWYPDLIDRMKVRHTGKLFGLFSFERTHGDYESTLVAVKDGPVRVIRRTSNTVRIVWFLSTPEVLIDYVAYPNAVFMDTHIDLPFRLGTVLSDIDTFTTVDFNDNPEFPTSRIYTESLVNGTAIDGQMSADEESLNESGDSWLVLNNQFATIMVGLVLDEKLPVTRQVYILDDRTHMDPPEDVPGQFGNVGYLSDNWEDVESGLQHMLLGFYIGKDILPDQGIRILQNAPWDM